MREDIYRRESMAGTFERCEAHESLEKEEQSGEGTGPRKSIDKLMTRISFAINARIFILAFMSSDQTIRTVIIFV